MTKYAEMFGGHYLRPVKIQNGTMEINTAVSDYVKGMPMPISEAKLDGTKYVVYDPHVVNLDKWIVAYYDKNHWVPYIETHITELNPTHFVEYYERLAA